MSGDNIEKLVLALAAAVVGAFLKALFDLWADSRKAHREREQRYEQRLDAYRLRQTDLQRKYLIELQEECSKYFRFISMLYHHNFGECMMGKDWSTTSIPEEIDDGCKRHGLSVSIISSRLHNDEIRGIVEDLKQVCGSIYLYENANELTECFAKLHIISNDASEKMGKAIRDLDHAEQASLMNFKL